VGDVLGIVRANRYSFNGYTNAEIMREQCGLVAKSSCG
jgi:hypothetical protein